MKNKFKQTDKMELKENRFMGFAIGSFASWTLFLFIALGMYGCPRYNVWQQEMSGKAEFAKAEQNRKIKVEEAKANLESEKYNAESEIERAKGVAEANKIIGDGLKGNSDYLTYLWIKGLNDGSSEVIYIPTEANLPILEAGKTLNTTNSKKDETQKEEKKENKTLHETLSDH